MTGARIHSGKKTDKSPKPLTKLDPIGQTTNKGATQETTNKHEPVSTRKHTRLESHSKSHHNYGNVDPNGYNSAPRAWESPWGKTQVGAARQFSHDMRGEGGSWVWCMSAACFNMSFENSELNCSIT